MILSNKRIFITGGSGFLGKHLISRYYGMNDITVFSRDEAKHYYLKRIYPNVRFIVGDIRNFDLLTRSLNGHQIAIFAASLKQIDAVNDNIEEGNEVIVTGGLNSKKAALDNKLEAACFISSDKSRAATTLYGAMKFVAGEAFIRPVDGFSTRLSCAIYGNVMNSTGSVIPLIWDAINKNYILTLYAENMTRFMLTIDRAIEIIEKGLQVSSYNVIPKINSFRICDLFSIYAKKFGLKYVIGQPRPSEKIHEVMIAEEEVSRVSDDDSHYFMHYCRVSNSCHFPNRRYSSEDFLVSRSELEAFLEKNRYYIPVI